jgi:hypothetical protein
MVRPPPKSVDERVERATGLPGGGILTAAPSRINETQRFGRRAAAREAPS